MAGPTSRTQADFTRLYESEFDYVWNVLRRLGVADAHLEDVAHDVFTTAWKKLDDYDPMRPLRPWLFGIAFRLASDFRDRAWQKKEVADPDADVAADESASPHAQVESKQARAIVLRAMEAMPLERRAVFVMHELEGQGIPEVADALQVPLNTAYSRLRLARRDFAVAVEKLRLGEAS
jgi:RNA polymerase sigma-70 factor (ECF subfamily)